MQLESLPRSATSYQPARCGAELASAKAGSLLASTSGWRQRTVPRAHPPTVGMRLP
jgi:hypothetical protein